jgi:hypothetical protein
MGRPIRLKDGTVVLAELKPGAVLTPADEEILAEWVQFVRDRSERKKKQGIPKKGGNNAE